MEMIKRQAAIALKTFIDICDSRMSAVDGGFEEAVIEKEDL
jgi:hypothetical protein